MLNIKIKIYDILLLFKRIMFPYNKLKISIFFKKTLW